MKDRGEYQPPCKKRPDLFFSDWDDGRKEPGRAQRETRCKAMCFRCEIRIECLEQAVQSKSIIGVWGGMGEGERRAFVRFLRKRGHRPELPRGRILHQELQNFYRERRQAV